MADIKPNEINRLGVGSLYDYYKMYIPKRVVEYLDLKVKEGVTFYQILDPKYRDLVILKKSE